MSWATTLWTRPWVARAGRRAAPRRQHATRAQHTGDAGACCCWAVRRARVRAAHSQCAGDARVAPAFADTDNALADSEAAPTPAEAVLAAAPHESRVYTFELPSLPPAPAAASHAALLQAPLQLPPAALLPDDAAARSPLAAALMGVSVALAVCAGPAVASRSAAVLRALRRAATAPPPQPLRRPSLSLVSAASPASPLSAPRSQGGVRSSSLAAVGAPVAASAPTPSGAAASSGGASQLPRALSPQPVAAAAAAALRARGGLPPRQSVRLQPWQRGASGSGATPPPPLSLPNRASRLSRVGASSAAPAVGSWRPSPAPAPVPRSSPLAPVAHPPAWRPAPAPPARAPVSSPIMSFPALAFVGEAPQQQQADWGGVAAAAAEIAPQLARLWAPPVLQQQATVRAAPPGPTAWGAPVIAAAAPAATASTTLLPDNDGDSASQRAFLAAAAARVRERAAARASAPSAFHTRAPLPPAPDAVP